MMRISGRLFAALAGLFLMITVSADAEDWRVLGEGSVSIDGDTRTWWVPDREAMGPQWRLVGSGVMGFLMIEAVPAPVGQAAMPKPSLRVEIMAPSVRPSLSEVLYTSEEGIQ